MKKISVIVLFLIILLPGCMYAIRYDGPYKGKIVDSETREPIEGVVVLGVWYTSQFSPAGSTRNYYDASETVTDNNGEFRIAGKGARILSNLEPMNVLIFKAGYDCLDMPWESFKEDILLRKKIKWDGNKPIIPLKKLIMEERKKQVLCPPEPPAEAPFEKIRLMLREIDKDDIERGLPPRKIWKGKEIK